MIAAYLAPIHVGSMIGFVTHQGNRPPSERLLALRGEEEAAKSNEFETYLDFAKRIEVMKQENLAYLREARHAGKRIWGFAAPAKRNTLLNYFAIATQYINCLVEKNELRRGLCSPGMHIPGVIQKDLA